MHSAGPGKTPGSALNAVQHFPRDKDYRPMAYQDHIIEMGQLVQSKGGLWDGISPEAVARMRLQNRFKTGLESAR